MTSIKKKVPINKERVRALGIWWMYFTYTYRGGKLMKVYINDIDHRRLVLRAALNECEHI
jgi:hypothetical protein